MAAGRKTAHSRWLPERKTAHKTYHWQEVEGSAQIVSPH